MLRVDSIKTFVFGKSLTVMSQLAENVTTVVPAIPFYEENVSNKI